MSPMTLKSAETACTTNAAFFSYSQWEGNVGDKSINNKDRNVNSEFQEVYPELGVKIKTSEHVFWNIPSSTPFNNIENW